MDCSCVIMLRVTNVQPRDFYITLEMSLKYADRLIDGLGNSNVKYDATKPETVEAKKAVEKFFEVLNEVVEGLEKDGVRSDSA